MTILGVESTSRTNSVAVWGEEGLLAEVATRNYRDLSRRLPGLLETALREANLGGYSALEGLAVSVGPGSFTGIRVGVSFARTLAQALELPIAGVSTLEAAAAQAPRRAEQVVVPIIPCRQDRAYCQAFQVGDGPAEPVSEPTVEAIDRLLSNLASQFATVHLCGEGADLHRELVAEQAPATWSIVAPGEGAVRAATVARLGRTMIFGGTGGDWRSVAPLYLTASAAERKAGVG